MRKFKPFHSYQKPLIGLSRESFLDYIETVIPKEHLARLVKEVVDLISTKALEDKYSFKGQKSYHPKLLLRILFYGYATGTPSSRKLEEKCISDHVYIYLMESYTPDHRTISDFRKNNIELIENYFVGIIRIFKELKMLKIGKIFIDGTKIKANASVKRSKTEDGFNAWLRNIKEDISALMKEAEEIDLRENEEYKTDDKQKEIIKKLAEKNLLRNKIEEAVKSIKEEDKKKNNITDPDANNMKPGGSRDIRPSYNFQATVNEDGIILSAEAGTNAKDSEYLKQMIDQTERNTNEQIQEAIADSGYESFKNYEYLDEKNIDGYIPDACFKKYKEKEYDQEKYRYHHSKFKYDSKKNCLICPEGKQLQFERLRINGRKSRNKNKIVFKGRECITCNKRALCTKEKYRRVAVDMREPLLRKMREKLLTDYGKNVYLQRQYTIEPIFGHLKHNLGYRNLLLRGIKKVNAEIKLMCIGWNLKKLFNMKMATNFA